MALRHWFSDLSPVINTFITMYPYRAKSTVTDSASVMAHQRNLVHPLNTHLWRKSTYRSFSTPPSFKKKKPGQLFWGEGTINASDVKVERNTFFNCCLKPHLWVALESLPARLKDRGVTQTCECKVQADSQRAQWEFTAFLPSESQLSLQVCMSASDFFRILCPFEKGATFYWVLTSSGDPGDTRYAVNQTGWHCY